MAHTGGDNLPVRLLMRSIAWVAALSLFPLVACSTGDSEPKAGIKIGVDLPLSGAEGQAGTPTLNGVRFFVHQHPVLDGFNVVVTARDDSVNGIHNSKAGAQNMSAFVNDPLVMGVIGPFNSSVARATIPVANQAHLGMISPSTSNQCLTKSTFLPAGLSPTRMAVGCKEVGLPLPVDLRPTKMNNFFRLATTDDLQGAAAADYAYTKLKLLRVAVLSDHEAYGQALANGFRSRFNKLGGLVVMYQDLTPGDTLDMTTFFTRAKKDGAQAIYFGGVTANHGCSIRSQMVTVFGAAAPYLGGDGIAEDPACVRDSGTSATGIHATVPAVDPDQAPGAKAAIDAFKAEYPNARDYGPYTMLAYDATAILYDALDKAIKGAEGKLPARADVVAKLAATAAFQGVTGAIGFDAAGDTLQRIVSIFQPTSSDPTAPWRWVGFVDYSSKLPY